MHLWPKRSSEERALLNPAFCSALVWQAASSHFKACGRGLPFELSFLLLPIVLSQTTRDSLPRGSTTSLPTWLHDNPLARPIVADRARLMQSFTRESLIFGGVHGLLTMLNGDVHAAKGWNPRVFALT